MRVGLRERVVDEWKTINYIPLPHGVFAQLPRLKIKSTFCSWLTYGVAPPLTRFLAFLRKRVKRIGLLLLALTSQCLLQLVAQALLA